MHKPQDVQFVIRGVSTSDLEMLYSLSVNDNLLNLPPDKDILREKIKASIASFSPGATVADPEYIFVLEDLESGEVIGTSTIFVNYASKAHPLYYFTVYDEYNSVEGISVKKDHQLLRLGWETFGISAFGGLIIDPRYRGLPEKRGKQISLIRMLFLGMFPELFHTMIISELMAPLNPDGNNPFWSAVGKKYTGYEYETAFHYARQKDRRFIQDYFPKEDIILYPHQKNLHRSIYSVLDTGRPQQHILTVQGFRYNFRIDPMDGGLQYTAKIQEIDIIKRGGFYVCDSLCTGKLPELSVLIGSLKAGHFYGGRFPADIHGSKVFLSKYILSVLGLNLGDRVYVSPF
ncbi:MAG: hypothetical protein HOG03_07055 [Desulfobacula sp.]|jgi:arginine N-succinyltransferase|uniref:arginine N-succinyltransferase n=1 Tax=Desulfobacula sp. TaxID=2593537 RepID=UPI001E05CD5F|nr:hypothetical protein [Desulfobacula sp.]MBT3484714.1 hypothetical protein [Desulfobacula sp.]MBT3804344.1 hypothetical protein [Desulfobacula sp.]MBT4026864.1 hypothetical protein [Desulfobacula sp.]MBT4198537.1 hypothetical protein [Desulfobacula sp.]